MPPFGRTLVLSEGRIFTQGPTQQVITAEMLAEVYGTPVGRVEQCGGRLWPIWG
jgi:ABC-type cobalamin/Fe3+-siderophores transport system ATPase subunit